MIVATQCNGKAGGKTSITKLLGIRHGELHTRDHVRIGKQTIGLCGGERRLVGFRKHAQSITCVSHHGAAQSGTFRNVRKPCIE